MQFDDFITLNISSDSNIKVNIGNNLWFDSKLGIELLKKWTQNLRKNVNYH